MSEKNDTQRVSQALRAYREAFPNVAEKMGVEVDFERDEAWGVLGRTLLPNLGGDWLFLVVCIAGGNNSGKSSVFNAILGETLSPAGPAGGHTKRCVAALSPALRDSVSPDVLLPEFDVTETASADLATENGTPGDLILLQCPTLPKHLLLIDTPDFDSVYMRNRDACEAVMHVADLIVAVVTKQNYNNREVAQFFRRAVEHGRPVSVVYNEASPRELDTACRHVGVFEANIGAKALAAYAVSLDLDIQKGKAPTIQPLSDETPLLDSLTQTDISDVKKRSLRSAVRRFVTAADRWASRFGKKANEHLRLKQAIEATVAQHADASVSVLPIKEVFGTFKHALDEVRPRIARLRGALRLPLRASHWARTRIQQAFRREAAVADDFHTQEAEQVGRQSAALFDSLGRLQSSDPEAQAWLRESFSAENLERAKAKARIQAEELSERCTNEFREFCRRRAEEWSRDSPWQERFYQALAVLLDALPVGAAGGVVVFTGGFGGEDVAAALGAPVGQWVTQLLFGSSMSPVLKDVAQKWRHERVTEIEGIFRYLTGDILQKLGPAAELLECDDWKRFREAVDVVKHSTFCGD